MTPINSLLREEIRFTDNVVKQDHGEQQYDNLHIF